MCLGMYKLVANKLVNGYPVWRDASGCRSVRMDQEWLDRAIRKQSWHNLLLDIRAGCGMQRASSEQEDMEGDRRRQKRLG